MTEPGSAPDPPLSGAQAAAVVERAAQVAAAGMPLAAGLRAAADEAESRSLARGLRQVADQLERGQSLDGALAAGDARLPAQLAGVLRAAQQSGRLPQVLAEWLENRRAARQHWQSVTTVLAYPAICVALTVVVYLFFATVVLRPLGEMLTNMGLKLPGSARGMLWLAEHGLRLCLGGLATVGVFLIVLRVGGGRTAWSSLLTRLPLVGPLWHWTGAIELLQCLALLVEQRVPLPAALRLTAGGIADAHLAAASRRLAERVEAGQRLSLALFELRSLPVSIVPLVRWGEQQGELAEALRSAAELLASRLRYRTQVWVQVLPPLIFVVVGVLALSLFGLVGGTLVGLIRGLT